MNNTVATINLRTLDDNLKHLKELTHKTVFPVIKANAYGHGMLPIAKHLDPQNYPFLCVSSMDEALDLYHNGVQSKILIFSYISSDVIAQNHQDQFSYTVTSLSHLKSLNEIDIKLNLHLEINTGMNRYGIKPYELITIDTSHYVEGVYTHFNSPTDDEMSRIQCLKFENFVLSMKQIPKYVHVGNAPLRLIQKASWINGVRFGLGMYGYAYGLSELKPILSLQTKVQHIDHLLPNETLGYDHTYTATREEIFATIPIGYGDGFDLRQSSMPVFINGKDYPIVGKICMDQCMIIIDDTVSLGDSVEVFGEHRTLLKVSQAMNLSIYVILTSLSYRLNRNYVNE